jgi:hypothetical protein
MGVYEPHPPDETGLVHLPGTFDRLTELRTDRCLTDRPRRPFFIVLQTLSEVDYFADYSRLPCSPSLCSWELRSFTRLPSRLF